MLNLRAGFEHLLEALVMLLMTALAVIVLLGVGFRAAGSALVWYDEVASILLAWLTYYGAALAALKRAHIGFPGFVRSLSPHRRRTALVLAELLVCGFFLLLAWVGWQVFQISEGDRLISLSWMPLQAAQSVIPIGAILFILAELLSLPQVWREAGEHAAGRAGVPPAVVADTISTE